MPALLAWLVIGLTAPSREVPAPKIDPATATLAGKNLLPEIKPQSPPPAPPPWSTITDADIAKLNFDVPPDNGVVTPTTGRCVSPHTMTAISPGRSI